MSNFCGYARDIPFEDYELATDCCHKINLRYYATDKQRKPLIIYFPGNAFIHGGPEYAHQVINSSQEELVFLCISTMIEPEQQFPLTKKF